MKEWSLLMMLMLTAGLSGCGTTKTAQELKQLQSQIGLLDQRVSQLERVGNPWAASPGSAPAVTSVPAPEPPARQAAAAASTSGGAKPGTREIQQALKNAGFYQGAVDGKMGPLTKDAVREFQRVHGLKDDGVVGRQTWGKLNAYADLSGGGEAVAGETLK